MQINCFWMALNEIITAIYWLILDYLHCIV
jgi:hypothetical protein